MRIIYNEERERSLIFPQETKFLVSRILLLKVITITDGSVEKFPFMVIMFISVMGLLMAVYITTPYQIQL